MQFVRGLGHAGGLGGFWRWSGRAIVKRRGVLALALIIVASLVFRLHISAECSLWLDEATTRMGVLKPWSKVLQGPSREHPPLMYVVIRSILDLFGDTDLTLRSLSLFFGCVLLAATYELCLQLGLTVGRALVAVGLLALSPFFIRYATEARHYAILSALITLATTRVLRLLRGPPRIRDLVGFVLFALAAACTQYFGLAYALALLGTLVAGVVPIWKRSRIFGRVSLVVLSSALLGALAFVALRAVAVGNRFETGKVGGGHGLAFNRELFRELPGEFSLMTGYTWSWVIEPALALAGLLLLTWRLRGVARLLPLGLALAPCVVALFLPSEHFVSARYLIPSAIWYHVAACVGAFAGIRGLRRVLSRNARAARLAPAVAWLALVAVLVPRLREYPNGYGVGGDDYRGLQRYFVEHLVKDTRLVAYFGFFGDLLINRQYKVGPKAIWLEKFRPVRGIHRYLVVEIHVSDAGRRADFESLIERKLGLSPEQWRALPLVALPHSVYQPAVPARLVELRK